MPKRKKGNIKDTSVNSEKPVLKQSKLKFTYTSNTDHQNVRRSTRINENIQKNTRSARYNNIKKYGMSTESPKNISQNTSKTHHNKQNCSINLEKSPQLKQPKVKFTHSPDTKRSTKSKEDIQRENNCFMKHNISFRNKQNIQRNPSGTRYSNTFKKYGMYVPSYEDILLERKNCDNYNDVVENLLVSVSPLPILDKFTLENQHCNVLIQDCKNLSLEKLKRIFKNNIEYLDKIHNGKEFCKRYEMYKNNAATMNFTSSSSMILFTNEQIQTLASLLCKTYGSSPSLSDYYFKVLLPELCLKIYIDEYDISYEEGLQYLDNYPAVIKI